VQRIDMPSVGQTTDELLIVEWLKKEGDAVALGDPLFSVQTDKAQVEVESIAAGTLVKVLHDAGETVRSGSPVAYIGTTGEAVPDVSEASVVDPVVSSSAESTSPAPTTRSEPERRSPERTAGRIAALPAARRLASALGIDLTTLEGTGQDGVITVRDVEHASEGAGGAT
jgi:pyruvate/2-oxoglutarate dehydrogenase complex dihydrolipoamide acyltransferase (E2) component